MALTVSHSTVAVTVDDGTSEVGSDEWNAAHTVSGTLGAANGGTGVANNAASTITITGAFSLGWTLSGNTSLTLPTSGTVATTGNKLSAFAATTSAELAGVISDETGSGALVFANTPSLTTPAIGAATGSSLVLTGTSANIIAAGAAGTTNPVITVDASTASVATGISIKGAAAAGRAALAVTSSGADEGLSIDAKGAGTIRLGATSTGAIEHSRNAVPTASDGAALGTTALMWSDLFLASGGVINFNNGNATITHAAGVLTLASSGTETIDIGSIANQCVFKNNSASAVCALRSSQTGGYSAFDVYDSSGTQQAGMGWGNSATSFPSKFYIWTANAGGDIWLFPSSNHVEQRNNTNGQAFRVYNTTDQSTTNYERCTILWSSNVCYLKNEAGGTGTVRLMVPVTGSTTVASLPSAATAGAGARLFVTDSNSTTFLATVAGGGANKVPVVSDGTNWLIG